MPSKNEYVLRKFNQAEEIAKNKNITNWQTLDFSNIKNKRFSIRSPKGRLIHFGLYPFKTGTYIDHRDDKKRAAWRARHSKIKTKNGDYAYLDPEQPSFYSWHILW
jgi:hypothetical protein